MKRCVNVCDGRSCATNAGFLTRRAVKTRLWSRCSVAQHPVWKSMLSAQHLALFVFHSVGMMICTCVCLSLKQTH